MDPMTPICSPSREHHRRAAARAILTGALLAGLCLFGPSSGAPLLADDEKPPSSVDDAGTPAKATPTPRPTPKPVTAPAKPAGAGAKPAPPAPAPKPAMKFDDFDLEKYHRPVPQNADDEDVEETGAEAVTGGTTAGGAAAPRPRPRSRPKPAPEESAVDPLKPFKDREAMEKFRQTQIETGRQRIAKLQERLNYLNTKRDALTNPAPLLVGQTQTQNPPAKPGEPPPPPTPIQGPGRGLTAKPGPGKMPVGGLFPPIPPPQTDEDKENDKKLKVKDLLLQVEEEIKSVQEEIETAQSELAAVETRFAQESQSR
jgi:hypothetical protein